MLWGNSEMVKEITFCNKPRSNKLNMIFPSGQERPAPWGMEYSQDQGSAIRGGQDHRVAIRGGQQQGLAIRGGQDQEVAIRGRQDHRVAIRGRQDLEVAITKYEVRDFFVFSFLHLRIKSLKEMFDS